MELTDQQIAEATGGRVHRPGAPGAIGTDTRKLCPGDWFLALVGERFDGHDFLERALELGVAGVVVSDAGRTEGLPVGVVVVEDTTRALQDLGRFARRALTDTDFVALTGSAGKTTTRALISRALECGGPLHQTEGNLNNHLGVPLTLLATPREARVAVIEMGTSSPGEIRFLAELCPADVRLITNIGAAHLEELGGLDGVAREKGAMFDTARPGECCVVNLDDPYLAAMTLPEGVRRVTWGTGADADVRLLDVTLDPVGWKTDATVVVEGRRYGFSLPVPARFLAHNAAGALAVALALGVDLELAARGLSAYAPVGMRLRREVLDNGVIVLNDAYNANPTSVHAALATLAELPGRRAVVLGDMLELGPEEARFHAEAVQRALELELDKVVLVGPRMCAALPGADVLRGQQPEDVVPALSAWLQPGDVLLLKGSRGARVERVLQGLTEGGA